MIAGARLSMVRPKAPTQPIACREQSNRRHTGVAAGTKWRVRPGWHLECSADGLNIWFRAS